MQTWHWMKHFLESGTSDKLFWGYHSSLLLLSLSQGFFQQALSHLLTHQFQQAIQQRLVVLVENRIVC